MPPGSVDQLCLLLGRIALLFLVATAPFLIAEGTARVFYDPPPIFRVWDPFAYRIPQPLLEEDFEGPEGDRVSIRLNELGMRGPSIKEAVPPDTLTLVFLGGSTTENYSLPREETFPELIGEALESRLDRPVRIFNAGMSAATTSTSLARLQQQVLDLEPSLVVVMHAINDLMSGYHPRYRADSRHLQRPPEAGRLPRSYLVDWLRRRPFRGEVVVGDRVDDPRLPSLPVFQRNLRSMIAIAGTNEIPILLLTQAHMYRDELSLEEERRMRLARQLGEVTPTPPSFRSLTQGMDRFNSTIMQSSADTLAATFDLASHIPRTPELIWDDCHLTRAGNLLVAEILAPEVEALLGSTPR